MTAITLFIEIVAISAALFLLATRTTQVIKTIKVFAIAFIISLVIFYAIQYSFWKKETLWMIPVFMSMLIAGKAYEDYKG